MSPINGLKPELKNVWSEQLLFISRSLIEIQIWSSIAGAH